MTFVVTWYQTNRFASSIFRTGSTASDASLVWAIRKAKSLGLKVGIKPHIDSHDGLWRAYISPRKPADWFRAYNDIMVDYASLLQQEGGTLLVVGAELITLSTDPAQTPKWRSLIATLRSRFNGKLTCAGNWGTGDFAEEFTRIPFWDALDYIGINAYFPVAHPSTTPTVESIKSFWNSWITTKISPYQQRFGKPVLFTEVGYRSATGTAQQPFNSWDNWPYNAREQVDTYEGLFQSWASIPWFAGTSFWAWNVNLNVSPTDIWYEVQNKPAQETVSTWFGGSSAPPPGPPTIQIYNPLSNRTYGGTITVKAFATNASNVNYLVDEGAGVTMGLNPASGLWEANLDTTTLTDGFHHVDVINRGTNGALVKDRAWNIRVSNGPGAPTATPTATPQPATPTATPNPAEPPSIRIANPESNKTYSGTIQVQAVGTSVQSVNYTVDGGTAVAMIYDSNLNVWYAPLDTTRLASGSHHVDVIGRGPNGATVTDRAWNILIAN